MARRVYRRRGRAVGRGRRHSPRDSPAPLHLKATSIFIVLPRSHQSAHGAGPAFSFDVNITCCTRDWSRTFGGGGCRVWRQRAAWRARLAARGTAGGAAAGARRPCWRPCCRVAGRAACVPRRTQPPPPTRNSPQSPTGTRLSTSLPKAHFASHTKSASLCRSGKVPCPMKLAGNRQRL